MVRYETAFSHNSMEDGLRGSKVGGEQLEGYCNH